MLRRTPLYSAGAAGAVVSTFLAGRRGDQDLLGCWNGSATSDAAPLFTSTQADEVRAAARTDLKKAILTSPQSFYVKPTISQLQGDTSVSFNFGAYSSVDAPNAVVNGGESVFSATPSTGDDRNWNLKGHKTLLKNSSGESKADEKCIVFAEHNKDLVALAVNLPQGQSVTGNQILYNIDLTNAKATKLDSKPETQGLALADYALGHARMAHAALVSGALDSVLKELLHYATTTARNDHMLYKTTNVQGHIAAIAGGKFALDALIDLCGTTEAPGAAVADLVKIFSSSVINDTLFHATQIVKYRGSPAISKEMIPARTPFSPDALSEDAKAAGGQLPSLEGVTDFTALKDLQTFAATLHHADCPLGTLKLNSISKFEAPGANATSALAAMLRPMDLSFQKAVFGVAALTEDSTALSKLLQKANGKKDKKEGEGATTEHEHLLASAADLTANLLSCVAIMAKATASGLGDNSVQAGEHRTLAAVQLELNAGKRKKLIADANRKAYSSSIEKMMKQSSTRLGSEDGYFSTHPTELKMKAAK